MTPNEDFSSILMELPMELPMHQKKPYLFEAFLEDFEFQGGISKTISWKHQCTVSLMSDESPHG